MRIVREARLRKRPLTAWRPDERVLPCVPRPHAQHVVTEKTQLRKVLGAYIKQVRRQKGLKKQDDLAAKTGLSVSVVSLAERGAKVESNTLSMIELALGGPGHLFEDFSEGRIEKLPSLDEDEPAGETQSVLTMTRDELIAAAKLVDEVYGQVEGDRFLQAALRKREEANLRARGAHPQSDAM